MLWNRLWFCRLAGSERTRCVPLPFLLDVKRANAAPVKPSGFATRTIFLSPRSREGASENLLIYEINAQPRRNPPPPQTMGLPACQPPWPRTTAPNSGDRPSAHAAASTHAPRSPKPRPATWVAAGAVVRKLSPRSGTRLKVSPNFGR